VEGADGAAVAHEDAERNELHQEVRAAVAHERQRQARHGQHTDIHTHMDTKVAHEHDGHPEPVE